MNSKTKTIIYNFITWCKVQFIKYLVGCITHKSKTNPLNIHQKKKFTYDLINNTFAILYLPALLHKIVGILSFFKAVREKFLIKQSSVKCFEQMQSYLLGRQLGFSMFFSHNSSLLLSVGNLWISNHCFKIIYMYLLDSKILLSAISVLESNEILIEINIDKFYRQGTLTALLKFIVYQKPLIQRQIYCKSRIIR